MSPDDTDTIRKVLLDIEESKLHNQEYFSAFAHMVTMLIFCKHEAEASRQGDSVRDVGYASLTSDGRQKTTEFLRDHAEEYKYGFDGDNPFKKRRL